MGDESYRARRLRSAARAFEDVLRDMYPEQAWVVGVEGLDGVDAPGDATAAVGRDEPRRAPKHLHAVGDGHDDAPAGLGHDDSLDQAA